jgi:acyl-CoA synthetase (NDP forming)
MMQRDLSAFFRPRAVALIGAAEDKTKIRGRILAQLVMGGYAGGIFPIHATHKAVQGVPTCKSIAAAPRPVDLALVAIPAASVPQALEECADAGVKSALVFSSGFAEEEGSAPRELQARVRDIARRRGILVAGPNSVGFLNVAELLAATFSPAIDFAALPRLRDNTTSRRIGIISQSGGLGFALFNRGLRRHLAFGTIVTTGNEADLDACDVLDFMLEDERTGAVLMFVETIRRGRRFVELARRALALGKPIIVAKIGRSTAGTRAAVSHTASLTGSDAAYEAVFRRYGVIRADDQEDMLDIAAAATLCPPVTGKRVGIVTISGGVGGWMADTIAGAGLDVPEFSAALQGRIRGFLPSYGAAFNPIDITAQAIQNDHRVRSVETLEAADEIDAMVVISSLVNDNRLAAEKAALAPIVAHRRKPILAYSYTLPSEESRAHLAELGLPCYTSLRGPALALSALHRFAMARAAATQAPAAPWVIPNKLARAREAALRLLDAAGPTLCECDAQQVLAIYGIQGPPSRLVKTPAAAAIAADALGYPVALKIQSPDLPHKSDVGGVVLGLGDAEAVAGAAETMLAHIAEAHPTAAIRGLLVQKMARPGLELIAGVVDDATFGPIVTLGLGGIHVEVLRDVAATPLPVDLVTAERLQSQLRGAALFRPLRGAPGRDCAALAHLLVRLARLAGDAAGRIASIDLNPVMVYPEGEGLAVVDALIVQHPAPREMP